MAAGSRKHPDSQDKSERSTRELAKAETREALILAAMTEFAEHGLQAPSLDGICARAGYTRGAFYVHFRDRDELIAAVMGRVIGTIIDAMIATGDAALDFERTVRIFVEAVRYGVYPPTTSVRSHHVLDACSRSPVMRDQYVSLLAQARERLSHVVREGQRAGTVRDDLEPEQVGLLLVAIVMAVQTLVEVAVPFDIDRAAATVIKMLSPVAGK